MTNKMLPKSKAFNNPQNNDFDKAKFDSFLQQLYGNDPTYHKTDVSRRILSDSQTKVEFNKQLELLLGLYVEIIKPYFNGNEQSDIIKSFNTYILSLQDPTYYNNEASSYNSVKGMLEKIVFYLEQVKADQEQPLEEIKKIVKNCLDEMRTAFAPGRCKIGVMGYLQEIHDKFNDGTSLANIGLNLTNLYIKRRQNILRQLADFHKMKYRIVPGNEVHVNFRFSQIAQSLDLGIPLEENVKNTQDIVTDTQLHINHNTQAWIEAEFNRRYNYSGLIDELANHLKNVLTKYNDKNLNDEKVYKQFADDVNTLLSETGDNKNKYSLNDILEGGYDENEDWVTKIKGSLYTDSEALPNFCENFLIENGFAENPRTYSGFWSNESKTMPNLKRLEVAVDNQDFYVIKKFLAEIKQAGMLDRFCSIAIRQGDLRTARLLIDKGAEIDPEMLLSLAAQQAYRWDEVLAYFRRAEAEQINKNAKGWAHFLCIAALSEDKKASDVLDILLNKYALNLNILTDEVSPLSLKTGDICRLRNRYNNLISEAEILDRVDNKVKVHYVAWSIYQQRWSDQEYWIDLSKELNRFPGLPGIPGASLLALAFEKKDGGILARKLLEKGARLQPEQLLKAAESGLWKIVKTYINEHLDKNQAKSEKLFNQLCHTALEQGNHLIVQFLIVQGSSIDPKLLRHSIAQKKCRWENIANYLRLAQKNARAKPVNGGDQAWENLLCQAALADPRYKGAIDVIQILLDNYKINPNVLTDGVSPRSLKVGDTCQVIDKQNKEYLATVLDRKDNKILVHYLGWSARWDEWLNLTDAETLKRFPTLPGIPGVPLLALALEKKDGGVLARKLLEKGAQLQPEQLLIAAKNQLWSLVQQYIDQHPDALQAKHEVLNQLCSIAIEQNNIPLTNLCALYGAEVTLASLTLAAEKKKWDIITSYIEFSHGKPNTRVLTELCKIAIAQDEDKRVQFLMNQGAIVEPTILSSFQIQGKLNWGEIAKYLRVVKDQLMIYKGDKEWERLLSRAVINDEATEVVNILLNDYDIGLNELSGELSPLSLALEKNDGGILARKLLAKGAQFQPEQLFIAAKNQLWPLVKQYLALQAKPEVLNQLCSIAIEQNNNSLTSLCALYGAEVNFTSLKLAAVNKNWDIVTSYICLCLSRVKPDAQVLTELCKIAIAQGEDKRVRFLMNQGAVVEPTILRSFVVQRKWNWGEIAQYLRIAQPEQIDRDNKEWVNLLSLAAFADPSDKEALSVVGILLDKDKIIDLNMRINASDLLRVGDTCEVIDTYKKKCNAKILKRINNKVYVHYEGWSDKWNEWIDLTQYPERFPDFPRRPSISLLGLALEKKDGGVLTRKLLDKGAKLQPEHLIKAAENALWSVVKDYLKEIKISEILNRLTHIAMQQGKNDMIELLVKEAILDPKILRSFLMQGKWSWGEIAEYLRIAKDQPAINRGDKEWGNLLCHAAFAADNEASKVVDILLNEYKIDPNVSTYEVSPWSLQVNDICKMRSSWNRVFDVQILDRKDDEVIVSYVGSFYRNIERINLAKEPDRFPDLPGERGVSLIELALKKAYTEPGPDNSKFRKLVDKLLENPDRIRLTNQKKEALLQMLASSLVNKDEKDFFYLAHKLKLDPNKTLCKYIESKKWKVGRVCFSEINNEPTPRGFANFYHQFSNISKSDCFWKREQSENLREKFKQECDNKSTNYGFFRTRTRSTQEVYKHVADYLSSYTK